MSGWAGTPSDVAILPLPVISDAGEVRLRSTIVSRAIHVQDVGPSAERFIQGDALEARLLPRTQHWRGGWLSRIGCGSTRLGIGSRAVWLVHTVLLTGD